VAAGARRAETRGVDYLRLTTAQQQVASDDSPVVLWRDGNRLGKSRWLAWDTIQRCRGTHPYGRYHRPPIRALVIGVSVEQMEPLMRAIWDLVPKGEIDRRNSYDPGRGITGKPPRIVFVAGPGKGSVISFATYRQGSTRIAGAGLHLVVMDEPPPESMYGEVVPRVLDQRGHIRIGMTPTPDMPPQDWLREKVHKGLVREHNFGLESRYCWPAGYPAPWLYQSEIDVYEGNLLEVEREMRMRGAWEPLITGRWLLNFADANIRSDRPSAGSRLVLGIDHGAAAGKQASVLIAVDLGEAGRPRVWIIDEAVAEGFTTPEHDAAAILAMLKRHGWSYDHVDEFVGDRPTGSEKLDVRKSNRDLRLEIARQLGRPLAGTRPIRDVKKWSGSLTHGMRLLNTLAGRRDDDETPHLIVHPRCQGWIEAAKTWAGDRRDPVKDVLDAGRYAVEVGVHSVSGLTLVARY